MSKPKRPPLVLLVLAGALVAGIAVALQDYTRFNDLHVVNGLPVAVQVTLDDGAAVTVPPGGRAMLEHVTVGTHVLAARAGATPLETVLAFVKGGGHLLVYDVGGTAPLFTERLVFTSTSSATEARRLYCGQKFIDLEAVDFAFVDPPRTLTPDRKGTTTRTHLGIAEGGLTACQSWALDEGTQRMWAEWLLLEARVDPSKTEWAAEELCRQGDFREAQGLLERTPSHRLYQDVLLASGQAAKARAKYARPVDDEAATDTDLFLAARLLPLVEQVPYLERALLRFPQSPPLAGLLARAYDRLGDPLKAVALNPNHLGALLRAGKMKEAWAVGQRECAVLTTEGALTCASVAARVGATDADWAGGLKPHQRRQVQALLGLPIDAPGTDEPKSFAGARELITKALTVPGPALALAGRATDAELRLLPSHGVWLLLTEAWRVGDLNAARRLMRHAQGEQAPRFDVAARFIATGVVEPELEATTDVHLAVLWLARGRRLVTLGESPDTAYSEAKRLDALHGFAWRALAGWPVPTPSARLAWSPIP